MKVPKFAEEKAPVDPRISMKEQLKTVKGDLANPLDNENRVFSPNGSKTLLTYRTLDCEVEVIAT